jgi:hypothetical protein
LLVLVGFLLRLWTIVGEMMLTAVAYVADFKGALNRPDAPGRAAMPAEPEPGPPGAPEPLTPAVLKQASSSAAKLKPSAAAAVGSGGAAPPKAV